MNINGIIDYMNARVIETADYIAQRDAELSDGGINADEHERYCAHARGMAMLERGAIILQRIIDRKKLHAASFDDACAYLDEIMASIPEHALPEVKMAIADCCRNELSWHPECRI